MFIQKDLRKDFTLRLLVMVLAMAFTFSAAFAQQTAKPERQTALSIDLFPMLKGFIASDSDAKTSFFYASVSYERFFAPDFGLGVQVDLVPGSVMDVDYFYLGMSAIGRYYTMSENFDKVFLGASVGFGRQTLDGGKAKPEEGGFFGLTAALQAGYRLVFSNNFYAEPSMSYVLSKSGTIVPLGWQGGLRFGLVF